MQWDFETHYPHLDIDILALNEAGHESGNGLIPGPINATSIPWIQDVDDNGDLQSDVWTEWQVTFRDVVILDEDNVPVGTFNLTTYNLQNGENYGELRQMFISTATSADFDIDGDVDGSDFLKWQSGEVSNPPSAEDLADWEVLFGTTSALSSSTSVPEPSSYVLLLASFTCGLRWRRMI